ncbi:MAG TPA: polysaccharide biosynthesis/export family protein [Terriglobia bacterium]|nr:polysaccharide biosynthesis/export family protein [Terriglobia bacterium]
MCRGLIVLVAALAVVSPLQAQERANLAAGESRLDVFPSTTVASGAEQYLISADDTLEIYVLDVPEISREYRVDPAGSIVIPLLSEPLEAAGLTPRQLSQQISDELRKAGMVSHPHVSVQVKASRVHSIAIAGAVKKPQIYPLFSTTTLLDALSQAEGLADDAGNTAIITRGDIALHAEQMPGGSGGEGTTVADPPAGRVQSVDLRKLLEEGDPASNVVLYPGDRVTVQRAGIVYVVGAVNRAGGFVLKNDREQMTVLKAVALADNLKSTAEPKKALIIRKDGAAPGRQIPVDLGKILAGRASDQTLLANDILFVPDSAGKKALHRAGEAAAQAAALLIYRVP